MLTALQASFWDRLGSVITLRRPVYDDLQRDPTATSQAWLIVLFVGLANGIGLILSPPVPLGTGVSQDVGRFYAELAALLTFDTDEERLLALAVGIASVVLGWFLWSWLLCAIGNRMASGGRGKVSGAEMRRLVGWSYSPQLALFLIPIPLIGPLLATLGTLWTLVTGVMAVRTAFDVGIGKAIAIGIIAGLVGLLVVMVIGVITLMIAWPVA